MNTSTATAKTLLRQAWLRVCGGQAGRLVTGDLDVIHIAEILNSGLDNR